MVRERRKSYYEATRRISFAFDVEPKNSPKKTAIKRGRSSSQLVEPQRASKRLRGISASPEPDINIIERKRRSRSQSNSRICDETRENQLNPIETVKARRITRRRVTMASVRMPMDDVDDSFDSEDDQPLAALSQPTTSAEIQQIDQITCKQVRVSLQRMNTETINNLLAVGNQNEPQRRMTTNDASESDSYISTAKKCITRRCTVSIAPIDWSRYHMPQAIDEHEHEHDAPVQVMHDNDHSPEPVAPSVPAQEDARKEPNEADMADNPDVMSMITTISPFCGFSAIQSTVFDENGPIAVQQMPSQHNELIEDALNETMGNNTETVLDGISIASTADALIGFSQQSTENCRQNRAFQRLPFQNVDVRVNDIISLIETNRNHQPEEPTSVQASPRINLTPGEVINQAIARYGEPLDGNIALERLSLNDDATTYFHESSQGSTHFTPAALPIRRQLFRSSQTRTQISWNLGPSISDSSMLVEHSRSNRGNLSDAGVAEKRKCFIDSPHISFGAFINYGANRFAVNCFDHGDENIEHHFLSKFSRSHFAGLNAQFKGFVYTTEITGNIDSEDLIHDFSL